MTIRPVDFNGMLQRTDDVSQLKHHDDSKPIVDQQNIQGTVEKRSEQLTHEVVHQDNSGGAGNNADARDEGKGVYVDIRNKKESKAVENKSDGKVLKKQIMGSFDIKI